MASAEFLEQALYKDVDENAVNAIVGSLENQLGTSISPALSQNNSVNAVPSQFSNVTPSASSISGVQKYNTNSGEHNLNIYSSANNTVSYNNVQSNAFIPQSLTGPVSNTNTEPIKVYSHPQSLSNPPNSVNFSLSNGVIGLSQQNHIIHTVPTSAIQQGGKIAMQPPLVIKQGTSVGQVGIQSGMVTVPMTVNSSMPGSVMTLNKPGGQNVVVTTQNIIPNVQILNMRPGAPQVAAQKSVATVSPRVVIGSPQVVGTRPANPGITLQTLQSLQPGQQGHLLLKTENGQYQLLRVGPAPAGGGLTGAGGMATASALTAPQAQTIRLSTVPAHPGVQTVSTSLAGGQLGGQLSATQPPLSANITPANLPSGNIPPANLPSAPAPIPVPFPPTVTTQKPSDNTKEKCRNFLANLLDLSSKEPEVVERNVRSLIQELIDALVEPEEFCDRLERLLNASPQPCLIGFLEKSLPLLRQSLVTKELMIEGINAPPPHIAFSNIPVPAQPTMVSSNVQMFGEEDSVSPTLTPLLPPVLPISTLTPGPNHNNVGPLLGCQQQKPQQQKLNNIAVLQNIPVQTKINVNKVSAGKSVTNVTKNFSRPGLGPSAGLSTVLTPSKSLLKEKEKKSTVQYMQAFDDKMAGDDDINDVAAMGGVNLAEETQRILGSTDMIGTQIRSCKDEYLVPMGAMQARVKAVCARHGLGEPSGELSALLSHALSERLNTIVEKLAVIAQHRIDLLIKTDNRYEVTQDVKSQLKFLEELDRVDKKRREDSERELLLRAAKSRSKNEDPEQAKLKAKAKEMQRAELEELRQREANLTALQAIGPRKKPRLDGPGAAGDAVSSGSSQTSLLSGRSQLALRTRLKRVNQRDMVYLLEQEKDTAHSLILYRSYLK